MQSTKAMSMTETIHAITSKKEEHRRKSYVAIITSMRNGYLGVFTSDVEQEESDKERLELVSAILV